MQPPYGWEDDGAMAVPLENWMPCKEMEALRTCSARDKPRQSMVAYKSAGEAAADEESDDEPDDELDEPDDELEKDEPDDELEELVSFGSANATAGVFATAAPTPSANATAPARIMYCAFTGIALRGRSARAPAERPPEPEDWTPFDPAP